MSIQYIAELIGTYVFALSGVLATDDKDRNWFGAAFTGFVTAIGGGSVRDVLLGSYPLVWIGDVNFLYAILAGVLTSLIFFRLVVKLSLSMLLFDMAGIALFTIVGVEKSLAVGASAEVAAIMGVFTAVMGGVIRDTLTHKKPIIFSKEVYATACLAGAILYLVLEYYNIDRNVNFLLSCGLIVVIRILVIRFKIELPSLKP